MSKQIKSIASPNVESWILSKFSVVKLQHWSLQKKNNKNYVFPNFHSVFSASPPKGRPLSFLLRAGPVVDSFDLPHRCCPALEFFLGVSFPTKKRGKVQNADTFIHMFFWKDSRRLRGAPLFVLEVANGKNAMNWSDIWFSTLRNDHDFRIFVPSSGERDILSQGFGGAVGNTTWFFFLGIAYLQGKRRTGNCLSSVASEISNFWSGSLHKRIACLALQRWAHLRKRRQTKMTCVSHHLTASIHHHDTTHRWNMFLLFEVSGLKLCQLLLQTFDINSWGTRKKKLAAYGPRHIWPGKNNSYPKEMKFWNT